jgi:ribonuclease HI
MSNTRETGEAAGAPAPRRRTKVATTPKAPQASPGAKTAPPATAGHGEGDSAVVLLYADGACSGNPGPGGWGAILVSPGGTKRLEISGADLETTNNRMEMTAVLQALRRLKTRSSVRVVTDSRYVIDGMKSWIHAWRRNGWRTSDNKPVKNQDLWEALSEQASRHVVAFEWVRGHQGHAENERCDEMAREAIDTAKKLAAGPRRSGI